MLARNLLAICAPLFLLLSTDLRAQEFSPTVEVDGAKLHLNGIGLRKATFLRFKVYWGALYLTERSSDAEAILSSPAPKQARLRFLRDVGVEKLKDAFTKGIEANVSDSSEYIPPRDEFLALLGDVKENDLLIFNLTRDSVEAIHNGKSLGRVTHSGFGSVLLSCWIGRDPPNPDLKEGMLGTIKQ